MDTDLLAAPFAGWVGSDFPAWSAVAQALADRGLVSTIDVLCDLPSRYTWGGADSDLVRAKAAARRAAVAQERHTRLGGREMLPGDASDLLERLVALHDDWWHLGGMWSGLTYEVDEVLAGQPLYVFGTVSATRSGDGWLYGLERPVYHAVNPYRPFPEWSGMSAGASAARHVLTRYAIQQTGADDLLALFPEADGMSLERLMDPERRRSVVAALRDATGLSSQAGGLAPQTRSAPVLPPPRMVRGHRDAELYAAEVLVGLGFEGARRTPDGADGGIDVVGPGVVAQVKMEALPTGRDRVQALAGIAAVEGKRAVFFALAGYTKQATAWADRAGMALLTFAFDGSVEAVNAAGRDLLSGVG